MTQTTLRLERTSPMTQTAVEILLVEDNPNDVEVTLHSLRSSNQHLGFYWLLLNQPPL